MPVVPPPVIALGFAGVQRLLAPRERSGAARRAAGATVAAAGLGLALWADKEFLRAKTTVNPLQPEKASALVTSGPFRYTRNPMYVGMASVLAGHALGRGGLLTWLPVAGFVVLVDEVQIQPEEAAMAKNFGDDYDDYVATTRRWL